MTPAAGPAVVTLTANPSLDRTLALPGPLQRGAVTRLTRGVAEPGGKGVNVARALAAAGVDVVAVLPAGPEDPLVSALDAARLRLAAVPVPGTVRTNYTLTEPDGTTTKLNEPGTPLDAGARARLLTTLRAHATGARWVVLAGSLPPGTPVDWYADVVRALRGAGARIAVDTSEAPLRALLSAGRDAVPDLLAPNTEELAQLTGVPEAALLADPAAVRAALDELHERGVAEVLLTRGAEGALLSTPDGRWEGRPPAVVVRSTAGAGDAALAGHLLADLAGADPATRLRTAIAYGTAATGLPGSAVPTPLQADPSGVRVEPDRAGTPAPVPDH